MPTAPRRPVFPTAVFLGDSVTTGGRSLSHPRNRWTSLVCEHLRWREVNLAADGMGFFVRRGGHLPGGGRSPSCRDSTWLETAVRAEPDVLTVCLGLSDAAALPFTNATNLEFHSLGAGKIDRNIDPFLIDIEYEEGEKELSSHEGEEFIYVLEGEIEVIYGKDTFTIGEGDTIFYDSVVPHHLHASDKNKAKILAVLYTPY